MPRFHLQAAALGGSILLVAPPTVFASGPDVIVGSVGGAQTLASEPTNDGVSDYAVVGSTDAFSVGSTSCNIGNVDLLWQAGNPNHPVIPQNLYRLKTVDGSARFEQVGQSWMKHAFTALTQSLCGACNGNGGSVLGVGCSDPYTSGRNGEQITTVGGLGPRFQVNPHKGDFVFPYMFRNTAAGIGNTTISRRLQVHVDDLNPAMNPGARYFFEAHYVTPDDADNGNQDNNASYREGFISGSGDYNATMAAAGNVTSRGKQAINAWKSSDPTVTQTTINTPEVTGDAPANDTTGRAILSAKATDLGGGVWHYEYALYNMNSDRAFKGFSIPADGKISNIGFHDIFYHSGDGFNSNTITPVTFDGTDWPGVFSSGTVAWNMVVAAVSENSNALRWGTLYNFRFDSTQPPTTGNATLTMFKTSATLPNTILVNTVVPTPPADCPADIDNNGAVDVDDLIAVINTWGCTSPPPCPADVDGSGTVDVDDLIAVILAWGACK